MTKIDESRELKPCKHCGSTAQMHYIDDSSSDNFGGYYIQCTKSTCGITTQLMFSCGDDCRPLLAEVWNSCGFKSLADQLFDRIKHGDAEHQEWLQNELADFFDGWSARDGHGAAADAKRMLASVIAKVEAQHDQNPIRFTDDVLAGLYNLRDIQASGDSRRGDAVDRCDIAGVDLYSLIKMAKNYMASLTGEKSTQEKIIARAEAALNAPIPPSAAEKSEPVVITDKALREFWRSKGGDFHGPFIETGTMPESNLLPFLRELMQAAPRGADAGRWEPNKDEMVNTPIGPGVFKGRSKLYWVVSFGVGRERRFSLDELSPHNESISGQGG